MREDRRQFFHLADHGALRRFQSASRFSAGDDRQRLAEKSGLILTSSIHL